MMKNGSTSTWRFQVTVLKSQATVLKSHVTVLKSHVTALKSQVTILKSQVTVNVEENVDDEERVHQHLSKEHCPSEDKKDPMRIKRVSKNSKVCVCTLLVWGLPK